MARQARNTLAQAGEGDPNVIAHPGFRRIPESLFDLATPAAKKRYDDLARSLFERGRLTLETHQWLSTAAMQFDTILEAKASGKTIRGSWITEMNKAFARLGLDNDKPIAAAQAAPTNKFARNGFAVRRGWPVSAHPA